MVTSWVLEPIRFAVVHVEDSKSHQTRTPEMRLQEAVGLVEALGEDVVFTEILQLTKHTPKTFIGGGQVELLAERVAEHKIAVLAINAHITPTQQRQLEIGLNCKVVDRTGLILAIFANRARTKAGKLQVELAALTYQQSRLVRTWTHLERQRGGLGKTGGPGERQLEIDRRLIRERITNIKKQIQQIEKERKIQRNQRLKNHTPVVALVGYTNAGKSTLFNALVGEESLAQDQVFATLDPLMRQCTLPSGKVMVLVDTVGFIADLPHELVDAFHATLEEVATADLLLHVQDATAPDQTAQAQDVQAVLEQIEAHNRPCLAVLNKIDALPTSQVVSDMHVSALKGTGISALLEAVENALTQDWTVEELVVAMEKGKQVAWLHEHAQVLSKQPSKEDWHLKVRIAPEMLNLFKKMT